MLVITVIATSGLFFTGCSTDDSKPPHANLGDYKIVSLTSSDSIDLDYDGIASTDFLEELKRYWFENSFTRVGTIHLRLLHYRELSANEISFRLPSIPRDSYHIDHVSLDYRFKWDDGTKIITVSPDGTNVINYHTPSPDIDRPEYIWAVPIPQSIVFNDANTVTVVTKQRFYDHLSQEWIPVELTGVFTRITE